MYVWEWTDLRKKRVHEKLSGRIARFFEVPTEAVSNTPVFHMCGAEEIEIVGCTGILEYTADEVVLACRGGKFKVCGSGLMLSDFRDGVLSVRGKIRSTSFGENEV